MKRKRVLVLGGGSGGIVAATQLGQRLGKDHHVTLIDQNPRHVYQSSYLWMVRGWREPKDITRDLTAVEKRDVRFFNDRVEHIDTDKRRVLTRTSELPYDYLVVSLGLQTHPEDIPGDGHIAHHSWELDAALRLRDALRQFQGGRIVIGVASPPYRCPPGPYEAAWLIEDDIVRRGLRANTTIDFFTSEPGPIGGSGHASDFIREHLSIRDIAFHPNFALETVDNSNRTVRAKDGRELAYDLLIVVPPHRPAQALIDSGLCDTSGIAVDPDTLATRWENVWVIGDAANMPASKAGVVAHQEADVVAHNIAHAVTGRGQPNRLRLHTI